MLHYSPITYAVHKQNHQDRIQDAEFYHLGQIVKGNKKVSTTRKSIASLGNILVSIGQSMQMDQTPSTSINTISRPVL